MTAFVVLAAGRGGRMGPTAEYIHKALLPVGGRAVISHQLDWLAPRDARKIVLLGHRAAQVEDFIRLAHPDMDVQFIEVPGWNIPGNGPGASLLAAREAIGDDDLIFTSCDTLWRADDSLWETRASWAAVADVPEGTPLERWCRIASEEDRLAWGVMDKIPDYERYTAAYTGLSMILKDDLPEFWDGIDRSGLLNGECQVTDGLAKLISSCSLEVREIDWTDTGDEAAYKAAVAKYSSFDWSKPGEVTYVLPEEGRVVKFSTDQESLVRRARRSETLRGSVPPVTGNRPGFMAYEYVPGRTGYEAAETDPDIIGALLDWASVNMWKPVPGRRMAGKCDEFYREKTITRIKMLRPELQRNGWHFFDAVDWGSLILGCQPVTFHGDFNLGNVIVTRDGSFQGIDWRSDFAGQSWGDKRYDLGKLLAGLHLHWGNARLGNFDRWDKAQHHIDQMEAYLGGEIPRAITVIAAVSLLNCAPLHKHPLDEICLYRALDLLERR